MAKEVVFFESGSWHHRVKLLQEDGTTRYSKRGGFETKREAEISYKKINVNNLTQATTTYCVFLLIGTGFPVPFFIQDHYLN